MKSLVDAYEKLAAESDEEMFKLAEEEAAGRIMARGFMDELNKLAQGPGLATIGKPPVPEHLRGGDSAPKWKPPGMPNRMPRGGSYGLGKAAPSAGPKVPGFERVSKGPPRILGGAGQKSSFTAPKMPNDRYPRNVTGTPGLGK